jgi:hypothetical protein
MEEFEKIGSLRLRSGRVLYLQRTLTMSRMEAVQELKIIRGQEQIDDAAKSSHSWILLSVSTLECCPSDWWRAIPEIEYI